MGIIELDYHISFGYYDAIIRLFETIAASQ